MSTTNTNPGNFANRDTEEVKAIASMGGKASHGSKETEVGTITHATHAIHSQTHSVRTPPLRQAATRTAPSPRAPRLPRRLASTPTTTTATPSRARTMSVLLASTLCGPC